MDYYKGIYFINIFKYYIKPFKKNNKQIQCNSKNENICFDKYIGNSILQIYRNTSKNIGGTKIDQNSLKCYEKL